MKIGVLGGTFNPIHNSHIYLAQEYALHLALEKIVVVPTGTPPHKQAENLASGEHRYNMCRLATKDLPLFDVSRYEIERPGKSYTYKTLRRILEEHPGSELFLIVGTDMFVTLQDWKNPHEIFRMATICAGQREQEEQAVLENHRRVLEDTGARCVLIDLAAKPLSSTEVREKIAAGHSTDGFIHPDVWKYIVEHGIYPGPDEMR